MLAVLIATVSMVALAAALSALFYHAVVAALRPISALPGVGRIISVTRGTGSDTFRLCLGSVFSWTVSVNHQKGALTGSIQIDSAQRWRTLGLCAAVLASFLVPLIAGVMMPAALVVVGVSRWRARAGSRSSVHPPERAAGSRAAARG
jgi:hypothetical protein